MHDPREAICRVRDHSPVTRRLEVHRLTMRTYPIRCQIGVIVMSIGAGRENVVVVRLTTDLTDGGRLVTAQAHHIQDGETAVTAHTLRTSDQMRDNEYDYLPVTETHIFHDSRNGTRESNTSFPESSRSDRICSSQSREWGVQSTKTAAKTQNVVSFGGSGEIQYSKWKRGSPLP